MNLLHKPGEEIRYSFSTLNNYVTCPARVYFGKLAKDGKIQTDPALPATYGSAAHAGIEAALKIGEDPHKVASLYVEKEFAANPQWERMVTTNDLTTRAELMHKCLTNFEQNFLPDLVGKVDPKNVEVRIEAPFRKGKLVGVVDLIHMGAFIDWKTGAKVPSGHFLDQSPQGGFYTLLAEQSNGVIQVPHNFVYVYLVGKNMNYTATKTGKVMANRHDPLMKYSFPVQWPKTKVVDLLNNYINPAAQAYESGVVYKNVSEYNCNSCQFRTVCKDYSLPSQPPSATTSGYINLFAA